MSKPIHVLFLNYEYPPLGGGAANATKYLLKEYGKRDDIIVHLITSSTDGFRSENPYPNVTIDYLDIGKDGNIHYQSQKDLLTYSWKAYRHAKSLMKENTFDVVHAFFGIPCGFLAQRLGLPYIVSLRGSDVPFYNPRFEKLDRFLFSHLSKDIWKKSLATVANSQGLKDLAIETSADQEIGVIYNGIDIEEFIPDYQGPHSPLRILGVGRLIPRKGFDILLDAARDLEVEITLVGEGPERESLEELTKGMKVKFTGAIDHDKIVKLYQSHDVFVLPSANEGMSNTVLEAMATGLPIITTNTGGTAELIDGNGFVVERDVHNLRETLEKILKKPDILKSMSVRSRQLAEGMSWSEVADEYVKLYNQ
jgi:glycosyltransferase involved in cell wall biosynthesis